MKKKRRFTLTEMTHPDFKDKQEEREFRDSTEVLLNRSFWVNVTLAFLVGGQLFLGVLEYYESLESNKLRDTIDQLELKLQENKKQDYCHSCEDR